jgi:ubiquinone/menaquinone biosynthesis C-methylase UbiE
MTNPSNPPHPNPRLDLHNRFSVNKQGISNWLFEQIELPNTADILELGCGSCSFWLTHYNKLPDGWRFTLTDSTSEKYAPGQKMLGKDAGFKFRTVDVTQPLPFDENRFDAIFANNLLYHLPDIPAVLKEFQRVLKPKGKLYTATYGEKHMDELYFLLVRFNPQTATILGQIPGKRSFSLENGAAQLRQFFWDVQLRRYEDALEVTESKPLYDYILSMSGITDPTEHAARLYELAAFIDAEIKEKGSLRITKAQGAFVSTK